MNEEIKIEKDRPLPVIGGKFGKYPWGSIKVGESFFLLPEDGHAAGARVAGKMYSAKTGLNLEFIVKTIPEGICVWRIK